MHGIYIERE